MPKGAEGPKPANVVKAQRAAKKSTQKGRARHFTSPEELAAQAAQLDLERDDEPVRRRQNLEGGDQESSENSSSEESDSDEETKGKGVEALIEIENPNRVAVKNKKLSELTLENAEPTLSRKQKEEIEREKQKKHMEQLRAEGKTDQARADLARLALIRQQREEAAKKREAEAKVKEAAKAVKIETTPGMRK